MRGVSVKNAPLPRHVVQVIESLLELACYSVTAMSHRNSVTANNVGAAE